MKIILASLLLVCIVYSVQGMYIYESACTDQDLILCMPVGTKDNKCDKFENAEVCVLIHYMYFILLSLLVLEAS